MKPQFEVGPTALGKGGVVRDAALALKAADDIAKWLVDAQGWQSDGRRPFAHLRRIGQSRVPARRAKA